jgi:hypothetical protein
MMTWIGKLTLVSSVVALASCSSKSPIESVKYRAKHNTDVIVEKKVHLMHRQEVINAIEDCKSANLRPVIFYSHRYVNERPIPMIADVTCAPKSGY